MDLILRSIKTNNWSADNFNNNTRYSDMTLVSGHLFDSCQLAVTWMSTIK